MSVGYDVSIDWVGVPSGGYVEPPCSVEVEYLRTQSSYFSYGNIYPASRVGISIQRCKMQEFICILFTLFSSDKVKLASLVVQLKSYKQMISILFFIYGKRNDVQC